MEQGLKGDFPDEPRHAAMAPSSLPMGKSAEATAGRRRQTILIVDDTPTNLATVAAHLEHAGFEVAVAEDGEEALMRAALLQPDLILLDVMMPGIDGFETCRRLKAVAATRDSAVLFMTALSDVDDKVAGFAAGGVDYITKPFQAEELLARVRTHLALRQTQRQLALSARLLQQEREALKSLLENLSAVPWEMDAGTGACAYVGPQVERQWHWAPERFAEPRFLLSRIHAEDQAQFAAALSATGEHAVECRILCGNGEVRHVRSLLSVAAPAQGRRAVRGISIDVTRQKQLELELRQAQKLESVGRLAAGIAHEINTPLQYISDNCQFAHRAVRCLQGLVEQYQAALEDAEQGTVTPAAALQRVRQHERQADAGFLLEQLPDAMDATMEGLDRVTAIVRSMREFAHPGRKEGAYADLNRAILSTLTVARNECKYVAEVVTELGTIPQVYCALADINQAMLNIIVNAAHAVGEAVRGTPRMGRITVRSARDGDDVVIRISDTGPGIPEAIRDRIFDPFFTTKEVGRGTGQGLAIAHTVIVERHGGRLDCDSRVGHGTTFTIRLPINPARAAS
jgi:signal transduction histidine kinase